MSIDDSAEGRRPDMPTDVRPGVPVGLLAACMASAWAAGASLLFGSEVLLLRDLPSPGWQHLLDTLTTGALRVLPLGPVIGVLASLLAALPPLRRRGNLRRAIRGVQFGGPLFFIVAPAGVVLVAAGGPDRWFGVALVLAGILGALVAAFWVRGHRALPSRWVATILAVLAPVWMTAVALPMLREPRPGSALSSADGHRVVLLGLDGATWSIADSLLTLDEMPNLASLIQRGARATLNSLEPTLSNRVWTSAVTGVVPERHGITDFFFDRRFIRVPTLWDLVQAQDGRVGVFEFLVTDPPLPVNGFVIPGWMAQNPTATHPPALTRRTRLASSVRNPFTVVPYLLRRGQRDPRENVREFTQTRLATTAFLSLHARYRPDLAACIWYGTDRLAHRMWRYFEPEAFEQPLPPDGERFRTIIPDYYREADRQLGKVVDALDDGRTFFLLMSDHGMGPMERVQITGYARGPRVLPVLGLAERWYVESPHSEMLINCRLEGRNDDWVVAARDHLAEVEAAKARFESVTRVDTGRPLFEVEIGDLEKVDLRVRVPDAETLTDESMITMDGVDRPASQLIQRVEVSGNHRINGILVIAGPGVRPGARLDDAVITDIAPTILYALGLPVAEDLDGRFLEEAFTARWRSDHPLRTVPTFGTKDAAMPDSVAGEPPSEELMERLRSLGYIQ